MNMPETTERESSIAGAGEALGQSERFLEFQERLSRVASVERPVLLIGERGTGKELAAGRLHYLSRRWQGPLVTLNCATLAPTLIEAELFGHEKGAFTGADSRRKGRFEAADNGTLFLDEIGAIPLEVQEKILRVVEYGSFERVGGSAPVEVDVRIIGATHADLAAMAARGTFKADLLDRLSFEVLFLPPLRLREEDILLLAGHFAGRMAFELGRPTLPTFSHRAVQALEAHHWPGNVRELKNVVERAVYRADGDVIDAIDFDPFRSPFGTMPIDPVAAGAGTAAAPAEPELLPLRPAVEQLELSLLRRALEEGRFNQRQAASLLGLSYDQLRGLLRKYRDRL
ncbi:phage shock protein operon transcriptional activator [Desulfoprunum sp.]|jgi:psp operon transcriptional activator|uniref:phage shock protein operon transcriptional activator n=1 Tax=Desulfoprunum sp. TaxID=2020866 RepID=UPI003C772AEC